MFRQDRTNPSTAVSNWKGRRDSKRGHPSTAVSTWLNGGLFGGGAIAYTTSGSPTVNNYTDYTGVKWTGSGTIIVSAAGLVDVLVMGGGGAGGGGAARSGHAGGGAGGG